MKLRKIKDAVPISERAPEIEDRAVPGHHCRQGLRSMPERGEGDLIVGANNRYIATLVERHSRLVMLAEVANKDTQSVINALISDPGSAEGTLPLADLESQLGNDRP